MSHDFTGKGWRSACTGHPQLWICGAQAKNNLLSENLQMPEFLRMVFLFQFFIYL